MIRVSHGFGGCQMLEYKAEIKSRDIGSPSWLKMQARELPEVAQTVVQKE
jgi:hypothetical protein